ncbi:uncharacterized protein LOC126382271 [Pectinophora gossypiella]|uniref:uncharacterized protein LOC126382271 n=1 Tax=Pectinophora gossypiella TaxID=13191 RepID=UPI00214E30F2|nr:uncharacterized protein LOC126382271 [Pectinophora gossypiella]
MASHGHGHGHHFEVVFTRKMEERKVFMEELKEIRAQTYKRVYKEIKKNVGPKWYQALSVKQRSALDTLNGCLYKDLLEGRPVRTAKVLNALGIYPRPNRLELLNCMYIGRNDSKDFLAELFLFMYNHYCSARLPSYDLNARLLLTSIFYLGLDNLLALLEETFKPDPPPPPPPKPKPKPKPILASPYLQEFVIPIWEPTRPKRKPPQPLPVNLDHLNEPYEEDPPVPRPPPPPPPPPPPKKRLPEAYCAALAGYTKLEPYRTQKPTEIRRIGPPGKKVRASKLCLVETKKKTYGLGALIKARKKRRRKPKAPSTGLPNAQYIINGVYTYNGKAHFVLGSVSIIPPNGDLIHGGYYLMGDEYVRIHLGIRAFPVPPPPPPCDCLKKWSPSIIRYLEQTKCHCGHYYDFGNEGTYPIEEPQFFDKPTGKLPSQFNYNTIYELDPRMTHVERELKRHWETDSVLHSDDDTDPNQQKKKAKKKKVVKKSSTTCLGDKPTIEDYLRCALRGMRRINIASKLPDVHLTPELKEWMRSRIYGPHTRQEKKRLLRKSTTWWAYLKSFQKMGLGKTIAPYDPLYSMVSTWRHKQSLNDQFRKYIMRYRFQMLKTHAYFNNLFWGTMFQAKFPDKHFRDIFFSYLVSRVSDVHIIHPYSTVETAERCELMRKRALICLPKGAEDVDTGGG